MGPLQDRLSRRRLEDSPKRLEDSPIHINRKSPFKPGGVSFADKLEKYTFGFCFWLK
jgi:hypothetical protein